MSFGTKQATESVNKGGFTPKNFIPGNHRCKINGIYVKEKEDKKLGGTKLELFLTLETEPIGGDFKGFKIDKDDESKGFLLGQVGNVRSNPYGYKTETKDGKTYVRENSIASFIHILCLEVAGSNWVEVNDGKFKTFEDFIDGFNAQQPLKDIFIDYAIGGMLYTDDEGYPSYYMNLVKTSKGERAFKNPNKSSYGALVQFDTVLHVYDTRTDKQEVDGFSAKGSTPLPSATPTPKKNWEEHEDDSVVETPKTVQAAEPVVEAAPVIETEDDDDPFAIDDTMEDPFDVD